MTTASAALAFPRRLMIQCATLSAPPEDSIILPNSDPSKKMKNHDAMKPVKPFMYWVIRSACPASANGGSSAMSLVSATSSAHSGVATNRLMPRMVRTISSARPPSSPIRLNILQPPMVRIALPVRKPGEGHGARTAGAVELYQGTSAACRAGPRWSGLVPWYSIFPIPPAYRLAIDLPGPPGATYSVQAGFIQFKQQARFQHDRFDNNYLQAYAARARDSNGTDFRSVHRFRGSACAGQRRRGECRRPGHTRREPGPDGRYRPAKGRRPAGRSDFGHGVQRRKAGGFRRSGHYVPQPRRAERHHRNLTRHQQHPDGVHSRRRAAGPGRGIRGGRRHLHRRRLPEPAPGCAAGSL